MTKCQILLGNEAIAHGLLESGCTMATSYPGTPASEVLTTLVQLKRRHGLKLHLEWSINEKVAFEVALANSYTGRRSAVIMKQVGLNVAADPLMSAAYTGVAGGFLVVTADDPGPHSSQTEQDSRGFAMMAKIPVLDPASPAQARVFAEQAFRLSEKYRIPVMLRPTTRICHARQDLEFHAFPDIQPAPAFVKDPGRWAATPKFRLILHQQLNEKIAEIAREPAYAPQLVNGELLDETGSGQSASAGAGQASPQPSDRLQQTCIVASGIALAHTQEILWEQGLFDKVPLYQVLMPYPLDPVFRDQLLSRYKKILILEETSPVIELQLQNRTQVFGRMTGTVPTAGELLPETLARVIDDFLELESPGEVEPPKVPGRRPTLCAGCPHRAAFFAIKKAFPKGIYPSDIGCYTLGLNLGAVDTVLCMGAAISQAAGFYHAYRAAPGNRPAIAATVGDSTFFHAGIPALMNAVAQGARFVLVILDNSTTAMTGHQPTPAEGYTLDGTPVPQLSIENLVRACGVGSVTQGDPYQLEQFIELLRGAGRHTEDPQGGVAVVIARHPCLMDRHHKPSGAPRKVRVNEECHGCGFCVQQFECPALVAQGEKQPIRIDRSICTDCGVCIQVCPWGALEAESDEPQSDPRNAQYE